jgi:hypothetical protein
MKLTIMALLTGCFAFGVSAADQPSHHKTALAQVRSNGVPAGAVEVSPFLYRYSDPDGKRWYYRETPFGVVRFADNTEPPGALNKADEYRERLIRATSAVEDGDSIRFSRSTPFGPTRWVRRKAELNDIEQAVWNRELEKHTTAEKAGKD